MRLCLVLPLPFTTRCPRAQTEIACSVYSLYTNSIYLLLPVILTPAEAWQDGPQSWNGNVTWWVTWPLVKKASKRALPTMNAGLWTGAPFQEGGPRQTGPYCAVAPLQIAAFTLFGPQQQEFTI